MKQEKNKPETAKKKDNAKTSAEKKGVPIGIQKKLREIIIDHIEFQDAAIPTVVEYLRNRSRELDPEKQGVNIILQSIENTVNIPTITMRVDNIPLGEAIKYICAAGGMEYTIDEKAVIITLKPSKLPKNSP